MHCSARAAPSCNLIMSMVARQRVQAGVARAACLPHSLLHYQPDLPVRAVRAPPAGVREGAPVLRRAEREHTHVLRARILRQPRGEALVGAVQAAALARHAGALHLRRHPQRGRDGAADATQHRALRHPRVRDHAAARVAARQAALPHVAARGRLGPHARERAQGVREDGRQEPHVQVLDAAGVGHQHHQPRAQRGADHERPPGADVAGGAVRHPAAAGRAHRLRHGVRAAGVHAGGHAGAVHVLRGRAHGPPAGAARARLHLQVRTRRLLPALHGAAVLFLRGLAESGGGAHQPLRRGRRRHRAQLAHRPPHQGGVHDRRRDALGAPRAAEGPVLGGGGAQGAALHGGVGALPAPRAAVLRRSLQGEGGGRALRQRAGRQAPRRHVRRLRERGHAARGAPQELVPAADLAHGLGAQRQHGVLVGRAGPPPREPGVLARAAAQGVAVRAPRGPQVAPAPRRARRRGARAPPHPHARRRQGRAGGGRAQRGRAGGARLPRRRTRAGRAGAVAHPGAGRGRGAPRAARAASARRRQPPPSWTPSAGRSTCDVTSYFYFNKFFITFCVHAFQSGSHSRARPVLPPTHRLRNRNKIYCPFVLPPNVISFLLK